MFTPSNVALGAREAGSVASQVWETRDTEVPLLDSSCSFVPVIVQTFGVFKQEAIFLIMECGHIIRVETGKPLTLQFLLQYIAAAIQ